MYQIISLNKKQLNIIQQLAHKIWPICYASILSTEQINYMLNQFYSLKNLENLHQNHHKFVVIYDGDEALGFASFQHNCNNTNKTKLHKIYVLTQQHQKGLGQKLMDYVILKAKNKQEKAVYLNVNRNNSALHFYEKNGFKIIKSEDNEIGNGYLMEDFVMEKNL